MSQKVGSHISGSEQVKNLAVILLTLNRPKNLLVILLLIAGHSCFLDTLLNPSYLSLSVKIFSCFCSYFCGSNFEFLFMRYGCSCILKKFLVTDQLELKKNKNTQSIFNIVFTLLM